MPAEMEIKRRRVGDVAILVIGGQVETHCLPTLSEEVEQLIADNVVFLCVNCRRIEFINSTALGFIVETGKRLKELGGELVLSDLSKFMHATARTLQLELLFEIFQGDEAALEHFQDAAG